MDQIQQIATRHGLSLDELRALLLETDAARSLITPAEAGAAIEEVARIYLTALASAATRFELPAERLVADRLVRLATELLAEQLSSVSSIRN